MTSPLEILPGDCILYAREGNGLLDRLFRWAAGPWGHAACAIGQFEGVDMVVEAIGRGVLFRELAADKGRRVMVRRPREPFGEAIAAAAWATANDPDAWYDAGDLVAHLIPRLITKKLFGIECGFGYRHDKYFYCSELYVTACDCAGYPIWPSLLPSCPSDLATVPQLKTVGEFVL